MQKGLQFHLTFVFPLNKVYFIDILSRWHTFYKLLYILSCTLRIRFTVNQLVFATNLFGESLHGDKLVCSLISIFSIKSNLSRRILILTDMPKKAEINK